MILSQKAIEILSPRFFLHNAYYCFLNMVHFSPDGLSVVIDQEGNSVFSIYSALLLLPVLFCTRKYVDKKRVSFLLLAGIVIGLNLLFLMLYQATGNAQFGYRYFFDVIPLIFLLLMFILPSIPMFIQMGLLGYGIFVNFYGSMASYGLFPSVADPVFEIVIGAVIAVFLFTERLEGTS